MELYLVKHNDNFAFTYKYMSIQLYKYMSEIRSNQTPVVVRN